MEWVVETTYKHGKYLLKHFLESAYKQKRVAVRFELKNYKCEHMPSCHQKLEALQKAAERIITYEKN
jgi:hypothetical protein